MKASKTYFLLASEDSYDLFTEHIDTLLYNSNDTYVHAFLLRNSKNEEINNTAVKQLRSIYFNRLICKTITNDAKYYFLPFFNAFNTFDQQLSECVKNYKNYTSEEEYILIGSTKSLASLKSLLCHHIDENAKYHLVDHKKIVAS
ncbi:hypothetical protein [Winogradskyella sp.]|jgi:hypothetical protein|uniref:hypothetical protein n=1 Tax=Winogradskyella sp. TaxID=1883156 RepID=UPI0025DC78CB|nr:hypothetical protein [Winogradskyella sp.]MCT4631074.1 hypothetical protein [Winogradskyella sp.]